MANELTVTGSLAYSKSPVSPITVGDNGKNFTVTGLKYVRGVQSIPTLAGGTAIQLGGIGTPGWFYLKNTDPTNYVDILSGVAGTALLRLRAGEFAMGRFAVAAPAALANTAAVNLEVLIVED